MATPKREIANAITEAIEAADPEATCSALYKLAAQLVRFKKWHHHGDDLQQEMVLKAWQCVGKLDPERKKTWYSYLWTAMYRRGIDVLRVDNLYHQRMRVGIEQDFVNTDDVKE